MIFLSLKKERNSNHKFIYGESHTAFVNGEFHLFALEIVSYIAKNIGCKFYVDDATGYLEHGFIVGAAEIDSPINNLYIL